MVLRYPNSDAKSKKRSLRKKDDELNQYFAIPQRKTKRRLKQQIACLPVKPTKKLILLTISNFHSIESYGEKIFPSTSWIAERVGRSSRQVSRALKELEQDGWILLRDAFMLRKDGKRYRQTSNQIYILDTVYLYDPKAEVQSKAFQECRDRMKDMKPRASTLMRQGRKLRDVLSETRDLVKSKRPPKMSTLIVEDIKLDSPVPVDPRIGTEDDQIGHVLVDLDEVITEFDEVHGISTPKWARKRFATTFCRRGYYEIREETYSLMRETIRIIKKNPLLKKTVANGHKTHSLGRLFSAVEVWKADYGQKCESWKYINRAAGSKQEGLRKFQENYDFTAKEVTTWLDLTDIISGSENPTIWNY